MLQHNLWNALRARVPVMAATVAVSLTFAAGADSIRDISGMVALKGNTASRQNYLIVNDKKDRDRPQDQGPRVGVVTVDDDRGLSYVDLDIPPETWGSRPANDLEGACRVPGMDSTYLLLESSYYKDRYGRIFMVRVEPGEGERYALELIRTYQLPRSGPAFNLEGIVCFRRNDRLHVLLGDRGDYAMDGQSDNPVPRGTLFYAPLPDAPGELSWTLLAHLDAPSFGGIPDAGYRHCSDMFLEPVADTPGLNRLWVVASYDPDNKTGPFRSEVFVAGMVDLKARSLNRLFTPEPRCVPAWRSDSLKIEALAQSLTSSSGLCAGSDDEALGGVWRNLAPQSP